MLSLVLDVGLQIACSVISIFPPSASFAKPPTFCKSLQAVASIVQLSTLGPKCVNKILYSPVRMAILPPMAKFA
jgi:hypothetical protein